MELRAPHPKSLPSDLKLPSAQRGEQWPLPHRLGGDCSGASRSPRHSVWHRAWLLELEGWTVSARPSVGLHRLSTHLPHYPPHWPLSLSAKTAPISGPADPQAKSSPSKAQLKPTSSEKLPARHCRVPGQVGSRGYLAAAFLCPRAISSEQASLTGLEVTPREKVACSGRAASLAATRCHQAQQVLEVRLIPSTSGTSTRLYRSADHKTAYSIGSFA